jgi:hypothetical protein
MSRDIDIPVPIVRVSKKLSSSEFQGIIGTPIYAEMLSNKLHIFANAKDDGTIWEILDHLDEHATGMFHMTSLGSDNIWRVYFEACGDMNAFRQLLSAATQETTETPRIESIVVNTTHDTE